MIVIAIDGIWNMEYGARSMEYQRMDYEM